MGTRKPSRPGDTVSWTCLLFLPLDSDAAAVRCRCVSAPTRPGECNSPLQLLASGLCSEGLAPVESEAEPDTETEAEAEPETVAGKDLPLSAVSVAAR